MATCVRLELMNILSSRSGNHLKNQNTILTIGNIMDAVATGALDSQIRYITQILGKRDFSK